MTDNTNMNFQSNWKYREFMQKNANEIMKYNTKSAINNSGNNPYCVINNEKQSNVPLSFSSMYDTNKYFDNSDLKESYMKKQQLKLRLVSPQIGYK
jgi:hypothetical protein